LTDETGTGSSVFAISPVLTTPNLGVPSSVVLTNASGTASININGTVGATTPAAGAFTTVSSTTGANLATSSGSVGMGTASPQQLLHLSSAAGTTIRLDATASSSYSAINFREGTTDTAYLDYVNSTHATTARRNNLELFNLTAAGGVTVFTNATERMRVDSSGNVGIGTASPTTKLFVSGNSASNISALTDGATITPDFSAANNFSVTLAGNRTLANPTGLIAGQSGVITITQDGTGSRTLAYGSYWDFAGGTAPTLSTAAAAQDVLVFFVTTSTRITCQMIANLS
jgi:hypothetical protein